MENSLSVLMSSDNKTGTITVKIIQNTNSENLLIVADSSNYSLLNLESHPEYNKLLRLDKTYKLIKCTVENDQIIPSNFKPILTKKQIEASGSKKKLEKIMKMANTSHPQTKISHLEGIEKQATVNSYHSNLTVMVI